MIEVRRAVPDDGDVLGEIHAAAWEAAYGPFFAPGFVAEAVRSRRTQWHERITNGPETILLATLESRPLALSYFFSSRPGRASLRSIASTAIPTAGGVAPRPC